MNDNNIDDRRLEALLGEALGDSPTPQETEEALRRIMRPRRTLLPKWLWQAAAILCLPVMVIAGVGLASRVGSTSEPAPPERTEAPAPSSPKPTAPATEPSDETFFTFDEVPFGEALSEVARHYGLSISAPATPLPDDRIHFRYPQDAAPEEVIDALNDLGIARLHVAGSMIVVEGDE